MGNTQSNTSQNSSGVEHTPPTIIDTSVMPPLEKPTDESNLDKPHNYIPPQLNVRNVLSEKNPGTFEDLGKDAMEIYPITFEGIKFCVSKPMTSRFQIQHQLNMTKELENYSFGATYVGTKSITPSEMYPVLIGEMETNGDLNARILHFMTDRLKFRGMYQTKSSKWANTQNSIDYFMNKGTTSCSAVNVDSSNANGIYLVNHLQNLTDNIDVGFQYLSQRYPNIPGGNASLATIAGRYKYDGGSLIANIALNTLDVKVTCVHKVTPDFSCLVDIDAANSKTMAVTTVAVKNNLPDISTIVKAQFDSNYKCSVSIDKIMNPLPFGLGLCASLDNRENQIKLGISFSVG